MNTEDKPRDNAPKVIRRAADRDRAPDLDSLLDQALAEADEPGPAGPPQEAPAGPPAEGTDDEAEDADDPDGDDIPDAPWARSEQEVEEEELAQDELERQLMAAGAAAGGQVRRGDRVTGTVVHIGDQDIFVDIGGKSEALLDADELRDADGNVTVDRGETLTLYVSQTDGESVRLSYKMALEARDREAVRTAFAERIPLEGRITDRRKGGYDVRFPSGQRAFLPLSQVELHHVDDEDLDDYVGRTFEFLITKYESDGRDLVVSRSKLLREEREQLRDQLRDTLAEGQIREGKVARIVDFGAFVDLGGLDGLVHVSEIQWGRTERPQDKLRLGETVRVKVLRVDRAKGTVSLSIKHAEGDPWERVQNEFVEGGTYPGKVTRLEAYGAFVELVPGLEGLVHVSELSWERVRHAENVVQIGEQITVRLIRIDHEKRRLGLSLKAVGGDPWHDIVPAWMRGQLLEGTVDKVAPFGVLVNLAPGVSGLIPNSDLQMDKAQAHLAFQAGKTVTVEIGDIDRDRRRVRLLPSDENAVGERAAIEDYKKEAQTTGFGTLGDMLSGLKLDD